MLWLATAFALDQVEGGDTAGAGSAGVAVPGSNAAITANPGLLGLEERYTFAGAFGYGERGLHWNFGAMDAKTAAVGFGVVYSGDRYNPPLTADELPGWNVPGAEVPNRKRNHDVAIGLGIPMADRKLGLGINGSLSFFNHDRQGKGVTGNLGAGFGWRPDPHVSIGLAGRNLLPIDSPGRELELLGGFWLGERGVGGFTAEGGAQLDGGSVLLLAEGGEVWAGKSAAIRGGWRLEDAVHRATVGFGAGSADTSLDLAAQVPLNALSKPGEWTFLLSIRFEGPDIEDIRPD